MVNLLQKAFCFFMIQIIDFHDSVYTLFKRSCNKDTDMWNMIICQYHIRTSSHNNEIFFFCPLTYQITLIKEDCIFFCQTMITVKIFQTFFQRPSGSLIFILNLICSQICHIYNRIFLRVQTSQYFIEYLCIVIVDPECIRQCKSNIVTRTSMCSSDTDDQMIIL